MYALPRAEAFTLFSPEVCTHADPARWSHTAASFLGASVTLASAIDAAASLALDVAALRAPATVTRVAVHRAPLDVRAEIFAEARAAVVAMGGAGFDALLARAQSVWQVACAPVAGDDLRAPLVVAATLAAASLAPVLPPEGGVLFGVKGARVRLAAAGWPGPPI